MNVEPRWISINEIAKMMSVSRTTVNGFRTKEGFPKAVPVGGRVVFVKSEVDDFLSRMEASRGAL